MYYFDCLTYKRFISYHLIRGEISGILLIFEESYNLFCWPKFSIFFDLLLCYELYNYEEFYSENYLIVNCNMGMIFHCCGFLTSHSRLRLALRLLTTRAISLVVVVWSCLIYMRFQIHEVTLRKIFNDRRQVYDLEPRS